MVMQIIDAGETMEEVEKKIQQVVLDKVKECVQGKSLSLLWSSFMIFKPIHSCRMFVLWWLYQVCDFQRTIIST